MKHSQPVWYRDEVTSDDGYYRVHVVLCAGVWHTFARMYSGEPYVRAFPEGRPAALVSAKDRVAAYDRR